MSKFLDWFVNICLSAIIIMALSAVVILVAKLLFELVKLIVIKGSL